VCSSDLVYGHKPLVAAGPGSFADQLIGLAGGRNVLSAGSVRYPTVPIEEILRLAPEVILDASSSGTGASLGLDQARAFWSRLRVIPAVKNGRVEVIDAVLWFRPGPRLIDGLERLAALLHPLQTQPAGR
jgi:iron complex transport system substrate-binding protein